MHGTSRMAELCSALVSGSSGSWGFSLSSAVSLAAIDEDFWPVVETVIEGGRIVARFVYTTLLDNAFVHACSISCMA